LYNNLEEDIWNTTTICTASRYYELHELHVFHPELPRLLLQKATHQDWTIQTN
jgi:hypothetical protein